MPAETAKHHEHGTFKDTLISIIIAFAMAFVFRGFVVEAFVIPTGSMAPTLLGAHMRFTSPESGYSWAVNPSENVPGSQQMYLPVQAARPRDPIIVHDPMTGYTLSQNDIPRRSGDRIFVLKYLAPLFAPDRNDCIVFKGLDDPQQSVIKRLVGLPGEEVALIDGDVFTRAAPSGKPVAGESWNEPGWAIRPKHERAQRAVWMPVFDSRYTPLSPKTSAGRTWFQSPWVGEGDGWDTSGSQYRFSGAGAASLKWDDTRIRISQRSPGDVFENRWTIDDRYPYNELPNLRGQTIYPVSDIRARLSILPGDQGLDSFAATLATRGHEFRAAITAGKATLTMRPASENGSALWTELASAESPAPLRARRVTDLEFWHSDQTLQLWIDGRCVLKHTYEWSPAERVRHTFGESIESLLAFETENPGNGLLPYNAFADKLRFPRPTLKLEFSGGPFTLTRAALDRDLFYRPGNYGNNGNFPRREHVRARQPAAATHPMQPHALNADQFMVCGDNSANSYDARLWDAPEPWAATLPSADIGVVPRDLVIGKAFFVYWPAVASNRRIWVPDFGRMRWIW